MNIHLIKGENSDTILLYSKVEFTTRKHYTHCAFVCHSSMIKYIYFFDWLIFCIVLSLTKILLYWYLIHIDQRLETVISIRAYSTEDTIENDENNACFCSLWKNWQLFLVFQTLHDKQKNTIYVQCLHNTLV